MMQEPTVYIVDDDPDLQDSLRWLLKSVGLRVETFDSAAGFLGHFKTGAPGCLVLDVRLPDASGLDLFKELLGRGEGLPVIFITGYADVPMAIRAMKSGAVDFLEKPFNRQALLERVQRSIRDDLERRRRRADREAVRARFRQLTAKEREVLELVKEAWPNKAIAGRLDITPRAVELRRSSIMKKLGVRSLAELLRLSIAHDHEGHSSEGRRDAR